MSSRRRDRSESDNEKRSSRKHRRRNDDADDYHGSSTDYKALYKQLRSDLKSERRTIEDLEFKIDEERRAAKKAKQDTTDLWKIYYQLQTELQESYEKNSQQSKQKEALQKELETLKSEYEKIRTGTVDPVRLKEALIAMQKEKLDMQKRFNDIVIENKKLREKEARYAPRIKEMEKALNTVAKTKIEVAEMTAKAHKIKHDLTLINFSKEAVDKYQRWNSMLSLECDQNAYQLRQIEQEQRNALKQLNGKQTIDENKKETVEAILLLQSTIRNVKADCVRTRSTLVDTIKNAKLNIIDNIIKIYDAIAKICKTHNVTLPMLKASTSSWQSMPKELNGYDVDLSRKYLRKFNEITQSLESCLNKDKNIGLNLDLRANVHLLKTTIQLWSTSMGEINLTSTQAPVPEAPKPQHIVNTDAARIKTPGQPARFGSNLYISYNDDEGAQPNSKS